MGNSIPGQANRHEAAQCGPPLERTEQTSGLVKLIDDQPDAP